MNFSPQEIRAIAERLLGQPNLSLSAKDDLRFGQHGSMSVKPSTGEWYDHERKEGGGITDLINREGYDPAAWLEHQGFWDSSRHEPNGDGRTKRAGNFKIVAAYSYTDESGIELFQSCRMENGKSGDDGKPEKTFFQRRPDGNGGYINNLKGVRQIPYRLPQLIEAIARGQAIFIPEGEKCVEAIVALGLAATCNAGGANKWPDEIAPCFKGADIVILPDNDDPGRKHARLVASKLLGTAKRIRVLELPGLSPKGDVVDWLGAGNSREALMRLAEEQSQEDFSSGPKFVSWGAYTMCAKGLFVQVTKGNGERAKIESVWVSAPFEILGACRDPHGRSWGKWLRWQDADQRVHTRHVSDASLQGDVATLCAGLADAGLAINRNQQRAFAGRRASQA